MFDPERTVDVFQEEVNPGRRDLVTWLNKKILENKTYQYAVCTELFEKGNFQKIVHTAQRAATLADEAKKLQRDNNALKEDYDHRIAKQLEIINKSSAELEFLRKKAVELDRCEDQLAESKKRYQAQINSAC
jgi:predicted metalloendopeptidase